MEGGCLGVFADELGLILGLCCVFSDGPVLEGIARRGAYVSGTAASDRVDSVRVHCGLAATSGRKIVWAVYGTGIAG
jgi:hypothetical protein